VSDREARVGAATRIAEGGLGQDVAVDLRQQCRPELFGGPRDRPRLARYDRVRVIQRLSGLQRYSGERSPRRTGVVGEDGLLGHRGDRLPLVERADKGGLVGDDADAAVGPDEGGQLDRAGSDRVVDQGGAGQAGGVPARLGDSDLNVLVLVPQ
jgi:hypothetical protein